MTPTSTMTAEAVALQHFLDAQRASASAILDGLTDEQLRTSVLPSGWTPLVLIKHLGDAERHWFQEVFCGSAVDVLCPDDEDVMASRGPVAEVFVARDRFRCDHTPSTGLNSGVHAGSW
ncbi:DUF664 domain-containing protein [Streptomyces sp. NPDC059262]|uniref:mycothiol transferase n=1 Tax=Streptomyces sp. NPDC059262 TaxID=3346797 RepID=UPI0036A76BA1